jgi:carboxypeptidase Taq
MYAAQFFNQAARDLGGLDRQFAAGEFGPLRDWLRNQIHERGQLYRAGRLLKEVTGESLDSKPLTTHLRAKFGPLYGLR